MLKLLENVVVDEERHGLRAYSGPHQLGVVEPPSGSEGAGADGMM